jgi:lysozyme
MPGAIMQYSKNGLALTESFEGCRLVAYQDSVGVWTIGYGHTKGVVAGMTCTQAQAEQWLLADVAAAVAAVNRLVHIAMSQDEFDALVDFTFNLGVGNFAGSTLLKLLNARDIEGAANEFEKWDLAGGVVVAGLLRRRLAERALFVTPDPA